MNAGVYEDGKEKQQFLPSFLQGNYKLFVKLAFDDEVKSCSGYLCNLRLTNT
jgi:hypothetical protein